MCHIIPSSKENSLWQKVSQNLVLGSDRVESAQSLCTFLEWWTLLSKGGLHLHFYPPVNTDLSLPNSPLPKQWQNITFVSWIILGLESTFTDRQAELRQGQSCTSMQVKFPARISFHADVAMKPLRNLWEGTTNKKGCPTVKPSFNWSDLLLV